MVLTEQKIDELKEKISGEIVLAANISPILKKWRNIFDIGQRKLASSMQIKVSSLSDYENGRRNNPSIKFVKNYVDSLLEIDKGKDYKIAKTLTITEDSFPFLVKEFKKILGPEKLFKTLKEVLYDLNSKKVSDSVFGITYINTTQIRELDYAKYPLIYGKTNKRILYFSKSSDINIIDYTLSLLKHFTGQQPVAVIIEDINPENNSHSYSSIKTNLPIFLTVKTKEELSEILKV